MCVHLLTKIVSKAKDAGTVSGLIRAWCPLPFWPLGVLLCMCNWGGLLDPRSDWSGCLIFLLQQSSSPAVNFFLEVSKRKKAQFTLTSPRCSQPRCPSTSHLTPKSQVRGRYQPRRQGFSGINRASASLWGPMQPHPSVDILLKYTKSCATPSQLENLNFITFICLVLCHFYHLSSDILITALNSSFFNYWFSQSKEFSARIIYYLFTFFWAVSMVCGNSWARDQTHATAVTWATAVTNPGP